MKSSLAKEAAGYPGYSIEFVGHGSADSNGLGARAMAAMGDGC